MSFCRASLIMHQAPYVFSSGRKSWLFTHDQENFRMMQVIGSEEEDSRRLLCEATAVVMRACLRLLGIQPLYRI